MDLSKIDPRMDVMCNSFFDENGERVEFLCPVNKLNKEIDRLKARLDALVRESSSRTNCAISSSILRRMTWTG